MSLFCPYCRKEIPVSRIRTSFRCPFCRTALSTNHDRILKAVIPIGVLAETALVFFISAKLGSLTVALALWLFIAGITAYGIYWVAVRQFVELSYVK